MGFMRFIGTALGLDNIAKASNAMADVYYQCNRDFSKLYTTVLPFMFNNLINKINEHGIDFYQDNMTIFLNNGLNNLTKLVIMDLNVGAAPHFVSIFETEKDFGQEIIEHLIKRNIPKHIMIGDNSSEIKTITDEFFKDLY